MSGELDEKYFDLLMRTLNYSMEFLETPSYASIRFMDIFGNLLNLQPLVVESRRDEFYEEIRNKLQERRVMSSRETRSQRLNELVQLFISEWRRR